MSENFVIFAGRRWSSLGFLLALWTPSRSNSDSRRGPPARPLRQPLISLNRMVQPAPQAPAAPKWSYEEWMKLVADRKINASNTWNLGLIDHFHEGEFLRDGDSINFQKASGTLDGCVVIYSSRVDSVDSETRALLNGLFDSGKGDDADSNDEDGHSGDEVKKKRQAGRVGATLEKDPTALDIKKIDREYLIDPLFKKTSADFDEGSASGLLLNHLSMSSEGRIVFDASDDTSTRKQIGEDATSGGDAPEQRVSIAKLRALIGPALKDLASKHICPSLKDFEFGSENNVALSFRRPEATPEAHEESDSDHGAGDFAHDDPPSDDHRDLYAHVLETAESFTDNTSEMPDPSVTSRAASVEVDTGALHANVFSYFDAKLVKRWAGPAFWRRNPFKDVAPKPTAERKPKKEKPKINFNETINEKALFATSSASTTLPPFDHKAKLRNLLPSDEKFTSADFFKLFLKPDVKARLVTKGGSTVALRTENGETVDECYLSQQQDVQVTFAPEDNGCFIFILHFKPTFC
ncbi:condensin complex subunit 2/barren [Zopfochytrium polystomum]|nr:condensin complex subunit 2/barren [Zopfochytrium polystomum]